MLELSTTTIQFITKQGDIKLINTFIIGYLMTSSIFYWRAALGVGNFLNAQHIAKLRELFIEMEILYAKQSSNTLLQSKNKRKLEYKALIIVYYVLAIIIVISLMYFLYCLKYDGSFNLFVLVIPVLGVLFSHITINVFSGIEGEFRSIKNTLKDIKEKEKKTPVLDELKLINKAIKDLAKLKKSAKKTVKKTVKNKDN